jgi:dephospho-CoA kinase
VRVAITGGIAEGKSTVLGYLASLGYSIQSADVVARSIFDGPEMQARLADLLGSEAPVSADALRQAIATRPAIRRQVNRVMHPGIMAVLQESGANFFEVPLLIEDCLQGQFDQVWVVTCGADEQLRRLVLRIGRSEAIRMLGVQLPTPVKMAFADQILRTNRAEGAVFQEVRALALDLMDKGVCRSRN